MTRWMITEVIEYTIEAKTQEQAEELFLDHGPGDVEEPVRFLGVVERVIEEADR